MPRSRRELGSAAEDRAAQHLLDQGYTLVTRRFTARGGEVDIIAMDGEMLVFVEVKSRRDTLPEEALNQRKTARIRVAVRAYLQQVGEPDRAHRVDLIAIDSSGLRHYRGVEFEDHRVAAQDADVEDWSANEPAG